jgi:hypothetical protein
MLTHGCNAKIIFYRTASGQNPIEDFLNQLPVFRKRPKKHPKEPLKLQKREKKTILGGK